MLRKPQDRVIRQALFWNPQGRSCPKLTWKRPVNHDLRQSRSDWQKIARLAQDRPEWHAFVDALCSSQEPRGQEDGKLAKA